MYGELVMYNPLAVPAFMLVIGLLFAFYGSRLVPLALSVCALFIGFLYGGSLLSHISSNAVILRIGPVIFAILFAVLVYFLYRAVFFAAGALFGFFAAQLLLPGISILFAVGIGILSGALVYLSRNFVFSVLTSLVGGSLTATGAVNLFAWINITAGVVYYWVILATVAICGICYQTRRKSGRK